MKRRIGGYLMSLLLIATLLAPLLEVRSLAAGNAYFTSVNDNLCPLNDETMPFWSAGDLYVPYTVFSAYDLGISYSKTKDSQSPVLYTIGKILEFDLVNGGSNNKKGTYYSANAIVKHGYTYFPLAFVSNYFGIRYSIINTDLLPVVRICNGNAVLSDSQFVDAAATLMAARYSSYEQSKKPPVIPKPDVQQPPEKNDEIENEISDVKKKAQVVLAIRVQKPEIVTKMLDILDASGYQATFFFEPEELNQYEDTLRRIAASGHRIGFVSGSDIAALENGNSALRNYTGIVTRITLSNPTEALSQAGYGAYVPDLVDNNMGKTQSARVNRIMKHLEKSTGSVRVLLCGDSISADVLSAVCAQMRSRNHGVCAVTEVECQ